MSIPLVFCYTGQHLPTYAFASLKLAVAMAKVPVVLLTDATSPAVPPGVQIIDTRDFWKRPDRFADFITFPRHFRNEFWIRTWERIPILYEFSKTFNIRTFVHAELDQIVFDLRPVQDFLLHQQAPLACPWQSPTRMIASLLLVQDSSALEELIAFAESGANFRNEMELLSRFSESQVGTLGRLRTLDALIHAHLMGIDTECDAAYPSDWLFDAARLGQFTFGLDPMNNSHFFVRPGFHNLKGGFDEELNPRELAELWARVLSDMRISIRDGGAELSTDQFGKFSLLNLHNHSKLHVTLNRQNFLNRHEIVARGFHTPFRVNPRAIYPRTIWYKARVKFDKTNFGKRAIHLKRKILNS